MASIRVLDKGTKKERFQVTYDIKTLNGIRKRKSKTFPKGTPMKKIKKFKREQEVKYDRSNGVYEVGMTLTEFFEEHYLLDFAQNRSPATVDGYRKSIYGENGLAAFFGEIPMEDITVAQCQKYVGALQRKGLAPKTIKNKLLVLSAMFEKARRFQYVEATKANPVSFVELPHIPKQRIEAYTTEELRLLLKLADESDDFLVTMIIYICSLAGLRRSEVGGLKEEDIDFENNTIHISRARIYAGEKKTYAVKGPKSEAGNREIFVPDELMRVLKKGIVRYKKLSLKCGKTFKGEGFFICYDDGTPMSPNNISSKYRRFMMKHTDDIRYLSLHKLRHTYASIALSVTGGDFKSVQDSLGHSSAKMTLDTYGHAYTENKKKQARQMEQAIFEKNEKKSV